MHTHGRIKHERRKKLRIAKRIRHNVLLTNTSQECRQKPKLNFDKQITIKFMKINNEIQIISRIDASQKPLTITIDTGAQISIIKATKLNGNALIKRRYVFGMLEHSRKS